MIVDLIPLAIVEQMLTENWIAEAKPYLSDKPMQKLIVVWKEFVEPGLDATCGLCLGRILENYKQLQDQLIAKVYDNNLLNASN